MITALNGKLVRIGEDRVWLSTGPLELEVLVAAADVPMFEGRVGHELTLHTSFYIEGDASGGNLTPRLIGFLNAQDRAFFGLFITVKGIGPRKALKAMILPAAEVAHAIETRDTRVLTRLPQIGKRAAEQVIAELAGKVGRFVQTGLPTTPVGKTSAVMNDEERDAVAALVALGERQADAERLLDRVKSDAAAPKTTDGLVRAMLRLRAGS